MTEIASAIPPWDVTLTDPQHTLILYFVGIGGFALLAGFGRAWLSRDEVGPRYRSAVVSRVGILGIGSLTYIVIFATMFVGYHRTSAGWVPNEFAVNAITARYVEWSITVPLLVAELLSVTALVGLVASRTRLLAMSGAFLMIFTGFIGLVVVGEENGAVARTLLVFVSCAFWVSTTILLVRVVRSTLPLITGEAGGLLSRATVLLLGGWLLYPVLAVVQFAGWGGEGAAAMQIGFSVADIVVKVGFAGMIHRVAKLRTAEDVRAGHDVHPEAIWIASVKRSDAGLPVEVFLPRSNTVHTPRDRAPSVTAVASESGDALQALPLDDEELPHGQS